MLHLRRILFQQLGLLLRVEIMRSIRAVSASRKSAMRRCSSTGSGVDRLDVHDSPSSNNCGSISDALMRIEYSMRAVSSTKRSIRRKRGSSDLRRQYGDGADRSRAIREMTDDVPLSRVHEPSLVEDRSPLRGVHSGDLDLRGCQSSESLLDSIARLSYVGQSRERSNRPSSVSRGRDCLQPIHDCATRRLVVVQCHPVTSPRSFWIWDSRSRSSASISARGRGGV